MADSSYFDTSPFDDDQTVKQRIAQIISPSSAESLVGPPPDSPPPHQPGQSTPLTGTLAGPPKEAIAKNLDTPQGRTSYNTGNVSSIVSPAQSVQPAQPLTQVQPLRQNAYNASPMAAGSSAQPGSTGTTGGGLRTVVRDLNGNPAGSPLSTMPAGTQPVGASSAPLQPASGSANNVLPVRPGVSPVMPANTGRFGVQQVQPAVSPTNMGLQNAVRPAPFQPGVPLAAQQAQRTQAYNSGPGPAMYAASQSPASADPLNPDPTASLRPGGSNSGVMPVQPATASNIAPAGLQRLAQDQSRLQYLQNTGSGVSQIKNPVGRGFARVGDATLSAILPGIAPLVGGTTARNQMLINRQLGVVGGDQSQLQAAAQLADTRSQIAERDAQGRNFDARANYYNPEPMSAGQAKSLGHPEWEGLKLDARDAERLVGGAAHNQTTLQTHFGGQQRNLSAEDAAAIRTPSLEGASMSNDEYQRLLQGAQRNQQSDTNNQRTTNQSDVNNRRTSSTRITTTGMRDDTSEDNSNRAHPGGGAAKPIPPGIRDRIESQKNTAINKARASFDNGESSMDDYLENWQQAQNDYEDRLSAQTGGPIPHTDIRSNVDAKGNWTGNRGSAQPQSASPSGFVTQKGNKVALGDPVTVNGRRGVVAGFNVRTGKAQVKWDSRN